jgi:hypothetical protein
MVINFTKDWQFSTKHSIKGHDLRQVSQTKLLQLGVWITDDLKWAKNTPEVVRNSYAMMTMLRKLNSFAIPVEHLLNIYVLFIRSRLEQSAVVWLVK